jgi:hypothetical protein
MYAVVLLLTMVISCIMLAPGLQTSLAKLPFCKDPGDGNDDGDLVQKIKESFTGVATSWQVDCTGIGGYLAVYRLCFIVTLFFLLMSLVMIGVRSSKDARAGVQNGFWAVKFLIIIGGSVGAFFIPEDGSPSFGEVWMVFGLIGGFLFIVIQLILIIDFAHSWAEAWVENSEDGEKKGWLAALLSFTFLMYGASVACIALFYVYYTGSVAGQCKLHEFFISFNMIICLILSVVSILPKIQENMPKSGLLQSSCITLYIAFLTWSAMSNSPDQECKFRIGNTTQTPTTPQTPTTTQTAHPIDSQSIIGLIIWFLCVLYSTIRTTSSSQALRKEVDSEQVYFLPTFMHIYPEMSRFS